MIRIECDNCERTFDARPEDAGGKMPCPFCGDVNRIPARAGSEAAKAKPKPGSEPKPAEADLPPDSGPERDICVVHPAMFRAHPFRYLALVGLFLVGLILAVGAGGESIWGWLRWPGILMILGAIAWWVVWFVFAHLWVKLTISNKRTVRHEGIIRRNTSEVLHDHVRNVEIRQSFWQRLLKVGYVGISSSGQDGIEIEVRDIPRPYELKALIDEYRDM